MDNKQAPSANQKDVKLHLEAEIKQLETQKKAIAQEIEIMELQHQIVVKKIEKNEDLIKSITG